jgi:hypothetical protein
LIDIESDPPSSGAVPTPRIPPPPHAPSNLMPAQPTRHAEIDIAPPAVGRTGPVKPPSLPAARQASPPRPADDRRTHRRAFRARAIVVAVSAACVVIASAVILRGWHMRRTAQTLEPADTRTVSRGSDPVVVATPAHTEPVAVAAPPVPDPPAKNDPPPTEPESEHMPAAAAPAQAPPVPEPTRSTEKNAEPTPSRTAKAPGSPPATSPVVPAPPATPPTATARRPKEPATDSPTATPPLTRPRFDPTKI